MEITEKVRRFISTNFYVADGQELTDDLSLLDQGIIDSTGVLEVVAFLEGQFGFVIADEEMLPDNLDSINRIVAFIERKRAPAPAKDDPPAREMAPSGARG